MHHARAREANTCHQDHHYADVGYINRFKITGRNKQINLKVEPKRGCFEPLVKGEMGRRSEEEGGRDRRKEGEKGEDK